MPGRVVAQWDKDDCEDLGIIKVDLLGLGMMSVMQDAMTLCRGAQASRRYRRHSQGRSGDLRYDAEGRHDRDLPGRKPRANGHPAAPETEVFLRCGH